jgi:hypothetical protein
MKLGLAIARLVFHYSSVGLEKKRKSCRAIGRLHNKENLISKFSFYFVLFFVIINLL